MTISPSCVAPLLKPRSIAIVGASPDAHSPGGGVLANLERFAFAGPIYLVNRNRTDIDGRFCASSIDDLPPGIDLAVLAIPQSAVVQAVEAAARRDIRAVVIFASGFAEVGEEGRLAQEQIAAIAKASGMLVAGPNCLGHVNFVDSVPLTFGAVTPRAAEASIGLTVLSQSGAISSVLRFACTGRNLPVSYAISTGNEVCVSVEDYLEYLVGDGCTRLFAMYIEQFRNPGKFLELARMARSLGKPIVLLHPGNSEAARKSAESHTGAMAGNYKIMRTLVERAGVVCVDTLEELIDVSDLLLRYPAPKSGTAIITDSGAFKGLALDYCESVGLPLSKVEGETAAALRKVLPVFVEASNPLDLTAQSMRDGSLYGNTLMPLLADNGVGSVVFGVILGSLEVSHHRGRRILSSIPRDIDKPVVITVLGDDGPISEDFVKEVRAAGIPFFRSPERALRALARVTRHGELQCQVGMTSSPVSSKTSLPNNTVIPEYQSKLQLKKIGIPIPNGALVTDLSQARAVAAQIGYPVALKAQSAKLSHKSDSGGVILDVNDEIALASAWDVLQERINIDTKDITLDGILIERMVESGLELILGAQRDRSWGAVILVGLGGIWTEVLNDIVLMSTDLSELEIVAKLNALKSARVLDGYRGHSKLDVAALAKAVSNLCRFVEDNRNVTEIDINPLIVLEAGKGVMALDALIVTGASEAM